MPAPLVYASGDKSGTIEIRGPIAQWWNDDSILQQQIAALGEIDHLDVVCNTRGGEFDVAIAMANILADFPGTTRFINAGVCMSAGPCIAVGCDTIVAYENSVFMVHGPKTGEWGDEDDLDAAASSIRAFKKSMVAMLKTRLNQAEEAITAMLKNDTWWTAAEAKEAGLVDEILPMKRQAAVAFAEANDNAIPDDVLAKVAAIEAAALEQDLGDEAPPVDPDTPPAADSNETPPADDAAGDDESPDAIAATLRQSALTLAQAANRPDMAEALEAQALADGHLHGVRAVLAMAAHTPAPNNILQQSGKPIRAAGIDRFGALLAGSKPR